MPERIDAVRAIYVRHFKAVYQERGSRPFELIAEVVCPEAEQIAAAFLNRLSGAEAAHHLLADPLAVERIGEALAGWIPSLFEVPGEEELRWFVDEQLRVGLTHAARAVPVHLFDQSVRQLRRELRERLVASPIPREDLAAVLSVSDDMVALATSLIKESFFDELMAHESAYQLTTALRSTLAVVLAGGRGSRLGPLTRHRAKPAIPFAGEFRVIDFPLSNCINSDIRRVAVVTQYKAQQLIHHLQAGWSFLNRELGEYVELWPAQQQTEASEWYQGTADAIYQNLEAIESDAPERVLVLAGDHVYRQDYGRMLAEHLDRNALATVSCIEVPISIASAFGLVAVDETGRVLDFVEKPDSPPSLPGHDDLALASMGIYLFEARFLFEELRRDAADVTSSHDFGRDILPRLTGSGRLWAHQFADSCIINEGVAELYWRDVGTVDAYWEANVDLTQVLPRLDLYDKRWPVRSLHERRPAAKFVFDDDGRRGLAVSSLVSAGCIVSGGSVRRSLLGPDVRVDSHALIEDSIVLQGSRVRRHCRLRRTIVDEGCEIPEGTVIGELAEEDERRFHRTPGGVTLVTRDMLPARDG